MDVDVESAISSYCSKKQPSVPSRKYGWEYRNTEALAVLPVRPRPKQTFINVVRCLERLHNNAPDFTSRFLNHVLSGSAMGTPLIQCTLLETFRMVKMCTMRKLVGTMHEFAKKPNYSTRYFSEFKPHRRHFHRPSPPSFRASSRAPTPRASVRLSSHVPWPSL